MKETLVIGKVIGAHSIHGEIKVYPITDDINRFFELKYVIINEKRYDVESVRIHKGVVLLASTSIPDRNAAEKLKGSYVEVLRTDAVKLEEGQYFIEDLKGIRIKDEVNDLEGVIVDILQNGGVDIIEYKINSDFYLMPYLNEYVTFVDLEEGLMIADLSKGLME